MTKATGAANFGFSESGSLVHLPATASTGGTLGWVDRAGRMTSVIKGEDIYGLPRLSPDGSSLAMVTRGSELDIWIRELERGLDTRLTQEGANLYPAWSPDGAHVTFGSSRGGVYDLYSKLSDLSSDAELLVTSQNTKIPGSWSPDGRTLVYYEVNSSGTNRDIWTFPFGGDPEPFLATEFNERVPRLSPDGHWVAYVSDQSGQDQVYVQRFPEGGGVTPISAGRGTEPTWSRDGRELFYRDGYRMMVVEVETEPDFDVGRTRLLFEEPYDTDPNSVGNSNYDVSLDGQSFLMIERSENQASELVVAINWFEELKRLVPID